MMHSATHVPDTVISRSVYNRETTVKHVGQYGSYWQMGVKASLGVGVLEFERPHGRPLYRVSSPKSHISAHTYMEKFKPVICYISQFRSYLYATMALVNFYTMEGHRQ